MRTWQQLSSFAVAVALTACVVPGREAASVFLDVQWSEDSGTLAFVSSSRDHKEATPRLADP